MPLLAKLFWNKMLILLAITLLVLVVFFVFSAGLKTHTIILALGGSGELWFLHLVVRDGRMRAGGKMIAYEQNAKQFVFNLWMIIFCILITLISSVVVHLKIMGILTLR